jgi:hypothetical protein
LVPSPAPLIDHGVVGHPENRSLCERRWRGSVGTRAGCRSGRTKPHRDRARQPIAPGPFCLVDSAPREPARSPGIAEASQAGKDQGRARQDKVRQNRARRTRVEAESAGAGVGGGRDSGGRRAEQTRFSGKPSLIRIRYRTAARAAALASSGRTPGGSQGSGRTTTEVKPRWN